MCKNIPMLPTHFCMPKSWQYVIRFCSISSGAIGGSLAGD
jgi:hypothetical protein